MLILSLLKLLGIFDVKPMGSSKRVIPSRPIYCIFGFCNGLNFQVEKISNNPLKIMSEKCGQIFAMWLKCLNNLAAKNACAYKQTQETQDVITC